MDPLAQYHGVKYWWPDHLALILTGYTVQAYGRDATALAETCGLNVGVLPLPGGRPVTVCEFPYPRIVEIVRRLVGAGYRVVTPVPDEDDHAKEQDPC